MQPYQEPYQERVVAERKELDAKLDKLKEFIMYSPIYKTLPTEEKYWLNKQYDAMAEYSQILWERIAAFS